ncbi:unnamed protein product [Coregonus sp. 'balchen']|nr:unnamed protein product [Coregonus sp. 'balchen']
MYQDSGRECDPTYSLLSPIYHHDSYESDEDLSAVHHAHQTDTSAKRSKDARPLTPIRYGWCTRAVLPNSTQQTKRLLKERNEEQEREQKKKKMVERQLNESKEQKEMQREIEKKAEEKYREWLRRKDLEKIQ